jgi:hypothetical protein
VEGKRPLVELGVKRKIILGRIFRKWDMEAWNVSIWLRKGTASGNLRMVS